MYPGECQYTSGSTSKTLYEKLGFIEKEQKLVYMVFSWNHSQRFSNNGYLIPTHNGSFSQATFMIKSPLNDTIETMKES
ncbi:hypothetical protein KSD_46470 [Ktedonobacter sp. SOSP1-85]|nr:hypothetical protein KSD_46470 [Ktedonobacter sp. SOSP1-85]